MFCQKCGANNSDGSKFCEKCGAPLEAPVAAAEPVSNPNPTPNPAPGYIPYVPKKPKGQEIANMVAGIVSDIKTADKKYITKAVAILLMFVTAVSMMIGLVKQKSGDYYSTANVFQAARDMGEASESISDMVDSADRPTKKQESMAFNYSAASVIFTIAAIVIGLAVIAFALAFFLLGIKSKNAAFVAQVACVLAAAGILLVFIGLFFTGEAQKKSGITKSSQRMTFTWGSIVALAAAVGTFFYIGTNKQAIAE